MTTAGRRATKQPTKPGMTPLKWFLFLFLLASTVVIILITEYDAFDQAVMAR